MRFKRAGILASLMVMIAGLTSACIVTPAKPGCNLVGWTHWGSAAGGTWVSAEQNYTGGFYSMLRSRASAPGPWEKFTFTKDASGYWTIRSNANGKYVTVETTYGPFLGVDMYGMLRAVKDHAGTPYEKFIGEATGFGGCALKSAATGRYVSAELNYSGNNYGMLRARALSVGSWEIFGGPYMNVTPRNAFPVAGHHSYADTWEQARSGGPLHAGTDIFAARNTPVVAVEDGVAHQSSNSLGGRTIWLEGKSGRSYYYAHLENWNISGSVQVAKGSVIGFVGDSGNAQGTSPHLHFGINTCGSRSHTVGDGCTINPYPELRAWES